MKEVIAKHSLQYFKEVFAFIACDPLYIRHYREIRKSSAFIANSSIAL